MKETLQYYFSTLGLYPGDLEYIGGLLDGYEPEYWSVCAESKSFESISELIAYINAGNLVSSFYFHCRLGRGNVPRVSLSIIGAVSSWEVALPQNPDPQTIAIAQHIFASVRTRLDARSKIMPNVPWHIARNILVAIPLALLFVQRYVDPKLANQLIFHVTISVAISFYALSYLERRRYYQYAVRKPKKFEKLMSASNFILVTLASSLITSAVEFVFSKVFEK